MSLLFQVFELLDSLSSVQGLSGRQALFDAHTREVILGLQSEYVQWTQHSVERLVFDTLLLQSGKDINLRGGSIHIGSLGPPLYRENRENGKKKSLSGKTAVIWKVCQTHRKNTGNLVCSSCKFPDSNLNLNVKCNLIFAAKIPFFFKAG